MELGQFLHKGTYIDFLMSGDRDGNVSVMNLDNKKLILN